MPIGEPRPWWGVVPPTWQPTAPWTPGGYATTSVPERHKCRVWRTRDHGQHEWRVSCRRCFFGGFSTDHDGAMNQALRHFQSTREQVSW